MYLLDTNVVSELRKAGTGKADENVLAWARKIPVVAQFLSVITVLEIEVGVLLIERRDSHQGRMLRAWLEKQVLPTFSDRILPVDVVIAQRCAQLHVPDSRSDRDALIAATALAHGMAVVTRNVGDFESTGVEVIDPWLAIT